MEQRIAATLPHFPWLVEEQQGQVVGYAYASRHHERAAYQWSVNVSVYIDEAHRRRGVGRALYTKLFDLLRQQGLCGAYAGITLPNAGSVGLHESLGFRPVGIYRAVGHKLGAWYDVGWWQLSLCERIPDPPPPRPPAWKAALGD
jgi:phosphinothricin acetyltransferase